MSANSNEKKPETGTSDLSELFYKTGLVVRRPDSVMVTRLFDELERYDAGERAETFDHLKRALNETRSSIQAKPIYRNKLIVLIAERLRP